MQLPTVPPEEPPRDIRLDADQAAVALKTISDAIFACRTLADFLKSGQLTTRLAKPALYMLEAHTGDLCKAFGVETYTSAERESRHADLRAANMKIRELERQLGATVGATAIKNALRRASDGLQAWWRTEGLGHSTDISFTHYGTMEFELSASLFGNFRLIGSKTPVSDRVRKPEWHQSLRDRGLTLLEAGRSSEPELPDTDANRAALTEMILAGLPTASVTSFLNSHRGHALVLTGLKVRLPNLQDAIALADEYLADEEKD